MRIRAPVRSVECISYDPAGGDSMTAAAFLAIWAGLDQSHTGRGRQVSDLPDQQEWTDGRWRAAFSRNIEAQVPRHREPLAARRHGILHIAR